MAPSHPMNIATFRAGLSRLHHFWVVLLNPGSATVGDPGIPEIQSPKGRSRDPLIEMLFKLVQMLSSPGSPQTLFFFDPIHSARSGGLTRLCTVRCHGWAPGLFTEILPKQSLAWKGMERDGKGWKGMERDGKGWKGMERDGKGWKGMERDGKLQWLHRLHVCCSCLVGILLWVVALAGTIQNQENEWCGLEASHRRSCPSANNLSFNNSGTLNMGVCVCVLILYVYIYIYTHIMCTAYKYVILSIYIYTQNFAATFDVSLFKWLSSQPKKRARCIVRCSSPALKKSLPGRGPQLPNFTELELLHQPFMDIYGINMHSVSSKRLPSGNLT